MEIGASLLEPVGVAMMGSALKTLFCGGLGGKQDSAARMHALARENIRLMHEGYGQPTAVRLVGNGGIVESVEQNYGTARKCRNDGFLHDLSTRRLVDEQLGLIGHGGILRVEHNRAQRLADGGTARLAQAQNLAPHFPQAFRQKRDMRCFAGAITAFEGDEDARSDGRILRSSHSLFQSVERVNVPAQRVDADENGEIRDDDFSQSLSTQVIIR